MKTLPVFRMAGALLLAVLFLNDAHSAEIRLKSGRTFEGTIKHITPQTVVVETGNQVLFLSADLVEMSAKDWLATAQTAFEQDNVEHAAILCRHALGKSKDLEEARELMRKIDEKRIQKVRETAIRAAQALADRQKALAAPPAQEGAPATPTSVTPPAGENPIEGTASAPSVSEAPGASTGLTSAGLAAAETGTPAPGTLGAGFRLEGPGPAPTPSGGGSGGGSQSMAGAFPPGFGALAALQLAAASTFAQATGQAQVPPAPTGSAGVAGEADTNAVVSTAEVTAFMQSYRFNPVAEILANLNKKTTRAERAEQGLNPVSEIAANPKRVPLLLAAIEREPAGLFWVLYLEGCFHSEHAAARNLPPARRSEVYARAIEYLTAAKETVSKALEAHPQNRQLKRNLGTLDQGLALAYVESGTRIKEARALAEAVLAANTVNDWNYGNIIYDMHSLLGRIALREGDVAAAKRHLEESGKTPGSPQLDSFGPDFVLAGELLQKGERDVVLEHLDKIAVFWANPDRNPSGSSLPLEHQKEIEKWKQTIRAGQIPDDYKWR
jgi:hypothetical protein